MAAKKESDAKLSFEDALGRLESIVEDMESGELSLEQTIARFEEGQKLLKLCAHTLNEVERKIEKLVQKGNELSTEPLDGEGTHGQRQDEGSPAAFDGELF